MTFDDVFQLHTQPEAKMVLLAMLHKGMKQAKLEEVSDACGMSVPEVSQGGMLLKMLGLNKARDYDSIRIEVELTKE